jgi:hypothetical protein
LLWALPFNAGPVALNSAGMVAAPATAVVASSAGVILGRDWIVVSRMLTALPTEDTRSLGGGGAP